MRASKGEASETLCACFWDGNCGHVPSFSQNSGEELFLLEIKFPRALPHRPMSQISGTHWYPRYPNIAGLWMFIPPNMVIINVTIGVNPGTRHFKQFGSALFRHPAVVNFLKNHREGYMVHRFRMGLSENSVPLHPMVLLIIIPTKWLFHWGYTPLPHFQTYPMASA